MVDGKESGDRTDYSGSAFRLGNLRVGKKIGEGGFGTVYDATIKGIEFNFAVKFLDPSPFNNDPVVARQRFFREAEILFKLRHSHIMAIYGVGEHEDRPYILMEKFTGVDLHRARERGAPSPNKVLPFIEQIATGLGFAHSEGVIHRDIKPTNLMAKKDDARILDFGIAALLDPDGSRLTKVGGTCVGDAFSAPELVENPRLLDPRCDIYSLGACWFWLLTGKAPKGLNWEAALRSTTEVAPEYERVILRCLSQLETRYTHIDELIEDVHALRCGERPVVASEDLSDDDALLLGLIARACLDSSDAISPYAIEQELRGALTRLSLVIVQRRLIRFGFIEETVDSDEWGNVITMLRISDEGMRYAEKNQDHIESLLQRIQPPPSAVLDEDLPF